MRPLVKWAGGKGQILNEITASVPENWDRYLEPFAGGVAVMVRLSDLGLLKSGIISDMNCELINLYQVVKADLNGFLSFLSSFSIQNNGDFYYQIRERFNAIRGDPARKIERSALFLVLNRLGFNGLWRVNARGKFNVPFGSYRNPSLPDPDHISAFSLMLSGIDITCQDFEKTCNQSREGDFVYLDPPYLPISKTSFFTGYTPGGFSMMEQDRLLTVCNHISNRGVKFLLSNSFSPEIMELYREYNVRVVPVRRSINSVASGRMGQKELLISNY